MHPPASYFATLLGALLVLVTATSASAQAGVYVSGAAFADVRAFGSYDSTGTLFRSTDNSATGVGGSIRVGTWLHPRWTLELGIDAASTTSVKTTDDIIIQIFPPPPAGQFDLEATTKFTSASIVVGYHPAAMKRVRLGYLAGFALVRARHTDDYLDSPSLTIGPDFSFGASFSIGEIIGRPSIRLTEEKRDIRQNTGAVVLAFEAAIDVVNHVAIVPELRVMTFSSVASGPGTFLIRPGIGIRWNF